MTPTSRTDVLDRAFPAPSDAFDRLVQLRDRRDRDRRIIEGGVAIVLVVAIVAALAGLIANRRHQVPAGPITPSNVGDLGLAWWGAAVPAPTQPIVAGSRVYVLGQDGTLFAFPSECPSERCDPIWSAKAGIGSSRPWGSAIVSGDRVYQPSSDGRLIGYPTSCSSNPCSADWIGNASGDLTSANPAAGDGLIFVGSDECCHGSRSYGRLFAFDEACASYPAPCRPSWTASLRGGFLGAQPIVAGGRVYVGGLDGTLYAFPTRCAPVGGRCEPLWTAETHGRYAANFGFGLPLHSLNVTPLVANGSTLYVAAGSSLYAFPLVCGTSPCPPEWIGHVGGWINDIAASSEFVYVSASPRVVYGRQGFAGGTAVFPAACATRCKPSWTFPTVSSPTIAGGVLYLTGSGDPGDQAFDARCGATGGACSPLWTMAPDNGGSVNFATVAGDSVYVSGMDGNLHVFKLGGSVVCCGSGDLASEARHPIGYLAFYAFVGGAIVWLAVRRRSRSSHVGVPG